jgi:Uncharacterized conserved protein
MMMANLQVPPVCRCWQPLTGLNLMPLGRLVIRYYGGIKLGTGGLARAYGGVIAKNLQSALYQWYVPKSNLRLQVPFAYGQSVHALCAQLEGEVQQESFHTQGATMHIVLPESNVAEFKESLQNASKGDVTFLND